MELAGIKVSNSKFINFFNKNTSVKNYLTQNSPEKSYVFASDKSINFVLSSTPRPLFTKIVYQINYYYSKSYGKGQPFNTDELADIVGAYLIAYYESTKPFNRDNRAYYLKQAQDIGGLNEKSKFEQAWEIAKDSTPLAYFLETKGSDVYNTILENAGDPLIAKFLNIKYRLGENPHITVDPTISQPQRKNSDEREKDKSIYYLLGAAGIIGGIIYFKNRKGKKGKRRK